MLLAICKLGSDRVFTVMRWRLLLSIRDDLSKSIPKLRLFARSVEYDHAKADDLVSRAVIKMLEKESQLDPLVNVIAYAITIIKNLVIDDSKSAFGKHDSLDKKLEEDGFEVANRLDETPESNLLLDDIMIVLRKMSDDCQSVLTRLAVGLSYEEISLELGWAKNTVGVRTLRCRKLFVEMGAELV